MYHALAPPERPAAHRSGALKPGYSGPTNVGHGIVCGIPFEDDRRGKEIDINKELLAMQKKNEGLFITLRTNASGGTVSPYLVFSTLIGKEEEAVRSMQVSKEEIDIE